MELSSNFGDLPDPSQGLSKSHGSSNDNDEDFKNNHTVDPALLIDGSSNPYSIGSESLSHIPMSDADDEIPNLSQSDQKQSEPSHSLPMDLPSPSPPLSLSFSQPLALSQSPPLVGSLQSSPVFDGGQSQSQSQSQGQGKSKGKALASFAPYASNVNLNPMCSRFTKDALAAARRQVEQQPRLLDIGRQFAPDLRMAVLTANPLLGRSMSMLMQNYGLGGNVAREAVLLLQMFHVYCFVANLWVPNPLALPDQPRFLVRMEHDTWEAMRLWTSQQIALGTQVHMTAPERDGLMLVLKRPALQTIKLQAFNFQLVTELATAAAGTVALWAHPLFVPHHRPLFYAPLLNDAHDFEKFVKAFNGSSDGKRVKEDPYRALDQKERDNNMDDVVDAWKNAFWRVEEQTSDGNSQIYSRLVRLTSNARGQLEEKLEPWVTKLALAQLKHARQSSSSSSFSYSKPFSVPVSAVVEPGGLFEWHEKDGVVSELLRTVSVFSIADMDETFRSAWQHHAQQHMVLPIRFVERDLPLPPGGGLQWRQHNVWLFVCYQPETLVNTRVDLHLDLERQSIPHEMLVIRYGGAGNQRLLNVLAVFPNVESSLVQCLNIKRADVMGSESPPPVPGPFVLLWLMGFLAGHPDICDDCSMTTVAAISKYLDGSKLSTQSDTFDHKTDQDIVSIALTLQSHKRPFAGQGFDPAWAALADSIQPNAEAFQFGLYMDMGEWPAKLDVDLLYAALHPHGLYNFIGRVDNSVSEFDDVVFSLDASLGNSPILSLNLAKSRRIDDPRVCPPQFIKWVSNLPVKWSKDVGQLLARRLAPVQNQGGPVPMEQDVPGDGKDAKSSSSSAAHGKERSSNETLVFDYQRDQKGDKAEEDANAKEWDNVRRQVLEQQQQQQQQLPPLQQQPLPTSAAETSLLLKPGSLLGDLNPHLLLDPSAIPFLLGFHRPRNDEEEADDKGDSKSSSSSSSSSQQQQPPQGNMLFTKAELRQQHWSGLAFHAKPRAMVMQAGFTNYSQWAEATGQAKATDTKHLNWSIAGNYTSANSEFMETFPIARVMTSDAERKTFQNLLAEMEPKGETRGRPSKAQAIIESRDEKTIQPINADAVRTIWRNLIVDARFQVLQDVFAVAKTTFKAQWYLKRLLRDPPISADVYLSKLRKRTVNNFVRHSKHYLSLADVLPFYFLSPFRHESQAQVSPLTVYDLFLQVLANTCYSEERQGFRLDTAIAILADFRVRMLRLLSTLPLNSTNPEHAAWFTPQLLLANYYETENPLAAVRTEAFGHNTNKISHVLEAKALNVNPDALRKKTVKKKKKKQQEDKDVEMQPEPSSSSSSSSAPPPPLPGDLVRPRYRAAFYQYDKQCDPYTFKSHHLDTSASNRVSKSVKDAEKYLETKAGQDVIRYAMEQAVTTTLHEASPADVKAPSGIPLPLPRFAPRSLPTFDPEDIDRLAKFCIDVRFFVTRRRWETLRRVQQQPLAGLVQQPTNMYFTQRMEQIEQQLKNLVTAKVQQILPEDERKSANLLSHPAVQATDEVKSHQLFQASAQELRSVDEALRPFEQTRNVATARAMLATTVIKRVAEDMAIDQLRKEFDSKRMPVFIPPGIQSRQKYLELWNEPGFTLGKYLLRTLFQIPRIVAARARTIRTEHGYWHGFLETVFGPLVSATFVDMTEDFFKLGVEAKPKFQPSSDGGDVSMFRPATTFAKKLTQWECSPEDLARLLPFYNPNIPTAVQRTKRAYKSDDEDEPDEADKSDSDMKDVEDEDPKLKLKERHKLATLTKSQCDEATKFLRNILENRPAPPKKPAEEKEKEVKSAPAFSGSAPAGPKKRGRPKGSTNKKKKTPEELKKAKEDRLKKPRQPGQKGPGRPKGAKGKPRTAERQAEIDARKAARRLAREGSDVKKVKKKTKAKRKALAAGLQDDDDDSDVAMEDEEDEETQTDESDAGDAGDDSDEEPPAKKPRVDSQSAGPRGRQPWQPPTPSLQPPAPRSIFAQPQPNPNGPIGVQPSNSSSSSSSSFQPLPPLGTSPDQLAYFNGPQLNPLPSLPPLSNQGQVPGFPNAPPRLSGPFPPGFPNAPLPLPQFANAPPPPLLGVQPSNSSSQQQARNVVQQVAKQSNRMSDD